MTQVERLVQLSDVTKAFGETKALDRASLDIASGEVHALIGANGCGKSTMIKILAGAESADPGSRLAVAGQERDLDGWNAELARAAGLRFVHQDLSLFPSLSVAENLAADGPLARRSLSRVDWAGLHAAARRQLAQFELDLDPRALVKSLRPADRTLVAVARALRDIGDGSGGKAVLVLDEPTASLPRHEVDLLLSAVRRVAARGHAVLYVSHRLDEILAVSDQVTVLRDGRNVDTVATADLEEDRLVELITGTTRSGSVGDQVPPERSAPLLQVRGLRTHRFDDLSLELHPGEVVGIAGMLGSGRSHLLKALFGAVGHQGGEIRLGGQPVRLTSPHRAMRLGVAYIPEDRHADAAFLGMDLDANVSATMVSEYWRRGVLQHARRRSDSNELLGRFAVVARSAQQTLKTLSGGNQQKVVLARWLRRQPRIILLDEPTQGVDVGARADIHRLVREATDDGAAVLIVASDLQELSDVCDRVIVLRDSALVDEIARPHITPASLNALLYRNQEANSA